jgi:hypothetical protein
MPARTRIMAVFSSVGGLEADAPDIPSQTIGVLGHDLHGIGAVGLEDSHRSRRADAVTVQEDHNFANDLLVRPGGSDAAGSDSADPSDLAQALGLGFNRIEHLLAECTHQLLGVNRSDTEYHARAEVFLDAVERRRLRSLQKFRLKLLTVGAIVDPLARRRNPLAGRDDGSMSDDRDQFPVAPRLDAQDAKAGFIVVKSHALDRARQDFLRR